MNDERPTHGGAANMPPFPRAANADPARPVEAEAAADPTGLSEAPSVDPGLDREPGETAAAESGNGSADGSSAAFLETGFDPSMEAEPGSAAQEDEETYLDDGPDLDDEDEPGSFRSAVTSELARRAEVSLLKGMEHVADTFDETAHRLSRIAQLRGGPEALSLGPVHSTVGWLEGAADYLRSSDLEVVQSDLRSRVRSRPVQSLGLAVCAGWLLGRILR